MITEEQYERYKEEMRTIRLSDLLEEIKEYIGE